ncbi:MAG: hypothetical protein N2254_02145 [bacterium]|nr:hypothetical protein [bacterium]
MVIENSFLILLLLISIASDVLTICGCTDALVQERNFIKILENKKIDNIHSANFLINSPFRKTKLLIKGRAIKDLDHKKDIRYNNLVYEKEVILFFESYKNYGEVENIRISTSPLGCRTSLEGKYKIKLGNRTDELKFDEFILQADHTNKNIKVSGSLVLKDSKNFEMQIRLPEQRYLFFEGSRCHTESQGEINGEKIETKEGIYTIGEKSYYCDEILSFFGIL